jgi:hypothetical protein
MKAFKKGQIVIHFSDWDSKGTWSYTRAVVMSCGVKQMTLVNADTGVMMGRHFHPGADVTWTQVWAGAEITRQRTAITLPDLADEEAHAMALEFAKAHMAHERAEYERLIATHPDNPRYIAAVRKDLAELHAAEAFKR